MQIHNSISQNSSTQKVIQSPPQPQFLDLHPFLIKAGYKQHQILFGGWILPTLLWPYQFSYIHISPFLLSSASKPSGKSPLSTINSMPRFLGTHTQQMLLDRVVQVLEISAPTRTQPDPLSHLFEGKQSNNPIWKRSFYKKHQYLQPGESITKHRYLLITQEAGKTSHILHGYRGEKKTTNQQNMLAFGVFVYVFLSNWCNIPRNSLGLQSSLHRHSQNTGWNLLSWTSDVDSKKIKWSMKWSIKMQESRGTGN